MAQDMYSYLSFRRPTAGPVNTSDTQRYGNSYYGATYGQNPFNGPVSQVQDLLSAMKSRIGRFEVNLPRDSSGDMVARTTDPEVKDYMANILGGQRNALDDYVRRAAGAGIKRGGMNVVGGPALDSSLHQDAMKTLARSYSDRFGAAMDYNKYVKSSQYAQYADSVKNLQNLLRLQQNLLSSQANWQNRTAPQKPQDYRADSGSNRQIAGKYASTGGSQPPTSSAILSSIASKSSGQGDPFAGAQTDLMNQLLQAQRRQNAWQQEDRQQAIDANNTRDQFWNLLRNPPPGFNGTGNILAKRLGVELGYMKP